MVVDHWNCFVSVRTRFETTAVQNASNLDTCEPYFPHSKLPSWRMDRSDITKDCNTYIKVVAIRTTNQLRPQYAFWQYLEIPMKVMIITTNQKRISMVFKIW